MTTTDTPSPITSNEPPPTTSAAPAAKTTIKINWLQVLERTAWSAVQSLAAVYIAKGTITISASEIALLTALTAFLTLVKSAILAYFDAKKGNVAGWLEDTTARAAFTFAEVLLASLITAAVTPLSLASFKAAIVAAAAAALAGVKAAFAQSIGFPSSAATLTEPADWTPSASTSA